MVPFYRVILKRAWKMSWQYKWLWFFGFFAAFIGQGSVYEYLFRSFSNLANGQPFLTTLTEYANSGVMGMISWGNFATLWSSDMNAFGSGILLILFVLCLFALLISFAVVGQAGLIKSTVDLDTGKKTNLTKSFKTGVDKFWQVFGINLFMKVIVFGALVILAYIAFGFIGTVNYGVNLLYVFVFVVFIIISIVIYFLTIYGSAYIVLKNKSIKHAIADAWELFRAHVVVSLEMGLLLFIITFLLACLIFVCLFILISPLLLVYFILLMVDSYVMLTLIAVLMIIIVVTTFVLMGAWLSTFQISCWILLFEELALSPKKSKLQKIVEHVKTKRKKK